MKRFLALALLVPLAACGDRDRPDVDFGGSDLGPDMYAIHSRDGGVKMGLTPEFVYFALSDSVVQAARAQVDSSTDAEDAPGFIGGLVQKTVGKALRFRARYAVADVQDIRWEDGKMRFVFTDPDRRLDDSFSVDDQPATEAFSQADVEGFAEVFRKVKASR